MLRRNVAGCRHDGAAGPVVPIRLLCDNQQQIVDGILPDSVGLYLSAQCRGLREEGIFQA